MIERYTYYVRFYGCRMFTWQGEFVHAHTKILHLKEIHHRPRGSVLTVLVICTSILPDSRNQLYQLGDLQSKASNTPS